MAYYSDNIPDHPIVANLMRTGYPDSKAPEYPHCPVCYANEISEAFVRVDGDIIGCDNCCEFKFPEDIDGLTLPVNADGWVRCPYCNRQAEMLAVKTGTDEILGCDECVRPHDAWDKPGCFYSRD